MGTGSGLVDTTFRREGQEHEQTCVGALAKYDVFLNHRGPDLKKTFVSHLSKALHHASCEPFLDAKALVKGRHAFNSINEALSGVLVHVAIFSPRYAESKYCLNELCDMLASQKPVIPVFYDVEPENLRWTDVGPFAEAFREHLRKGRDEDVVRWKAALLKVAAITGFKLVDCNGDTVNLEEKIVAAVLDALPTPPSLAPARHAVGLKESSANVINMLHKMGGSVGVIGICGMGGIGKTTLAKEVYNHEYANFGSWCFLNDVKEAKGVAVMDLQMKMVSDLLRMDAKQMRWDSARWFDQIRKHKQRVFLVVDDINTRRQFDELVPDVKELPPGSRVLITSRESGILKNIMLDAPQSALYYVPELSFCDSLELFVWCAFRRKSIDLVDVSFHSFVEDISRACGGLPLALEVMGGFLSDKLDFPEDERYWQHATLALQKNGDIITSLQMSYDSLVVDEDKRMFLDIACFMLGHSKRVAIEVWDSSGLYGSWSWSLGRLIDKCLVKVVDKDGEEQLSMHDLLRDMGRNVVMQRAPYKPEMWSHIWDPLVAAKVLQKKQGSDHVLALSVRGEASGTACRAEVYARMRELRYLLLDSCSVNGDFSNWSEELKWLQWEYFPHREFPSSLELPNLAVLNLANSKLLTRVCARDLNLEIPFKDLRMLILYNCTELRELPQHINKLSKLKSVNLENCGSLISLPHSLGELVELEYLNLSGCKILKYLPDTIVELLKLRELLMSWCPRLKKLPKEIGRLKNLEVLSAQGTALEDLPESFGMLQGLKKVNFGYCYQLRNLCDNFGCLRSLQHLHMLCCEHLIRLPESFSNLSNLEKLKLSGCKLFERLPPAIGKLRKLRILRMGRSVIKELPEDFGQHQSLREVSLQNCKHLQSLSADFGRLESLETLDLGGCESLKELPDSFSNLSNLEVLKLSGCKLFERLPCAIGKLRKLRILCMGRTMIKELPEHFGQHQSLREVSLQNCKHLQTLSADFGSLESLETLDLDGCESLKELPDSFSNLSNLEELKLSGCMVFERLPPAIGKLRKLRILCMGRTVIKKLPEDFGQHQSLREVFLQDCKHLQSLSADFGSLESLEIVNLDGCESLKELPESFSNLSNLEDLKLSGCMVFERLPPAIGKLTKLRIFRMGRTMIKELPEGFGHHPSLREVSLQDCKHLQSLSADFGSLESLETLDLDGCESLKELPDSFSNLSNLEELKLSGCKVFERLAPAIGKLWKLKILHMKRTMIKELPEGFGQLQSLTRVNLQDCKHLQTLSADFGCLVRLEKLDLGSCESVMRLPDSFSDLSNLEVLNLSWCPGLKQLPSAVSGLKKLKVLLMGSTALEELPNDFGQLHNLIEVDFNDCKQLQNLCGSFGSLGSLAKLNLMFCGSLKKLPNSFSGLSKLETLSLFGCKVLQRLPPSVKGLQELTKLRMGSTAVEELPEDFGELRRLIEVDFRSCKHLQTLSEDFGCLGSLQKLNLDGCESLTELPGSFSKLSSLKKLSLYGCKHIQKLPASICRLKNLRVTHGEYGRERTCRGLLPS